MAVGAAFPPYSDRRSRSVLRRLALMLAVLVTSLSLVVSTDRASYALVDIDLGELAKSAGRGAKWGGPAAIAGKGSNPVGWAITLGAMGWSAWSSRDMWFDADEPEGFTWEDAFAADPEVETPVTGPSVSGSDGNLQIEVLGVRQGDAGQRDEIEWRVWCLNGWRRLGNGDHACKAFAHPEWPPPDLTVHYGYNAGRTNSTQDEFWVDCQVRGGGAVRRVPTTSGATQLPRQSDATVGNATANGVVIRWSPCATSETPIGFQVGPSSSNAGWHESIPWSQTFALGWGTGLEDTGYLDELVEAERYDVEVECVNVLTQEVVTIGSRTSAADGGFVVPSCKQHLGEDYKGRRVEVQPRLPSLPGGAPGTVPLVPPIRWDEPEPNSPDWDPCLNTRHGCAIEVWIDNVPCKVGVKECEQWQEIQQRQPSRVRCMYAGRQIDGKWCIPLAPFYNPTLPDRDVDTKPDTSTPTQPSPNPTTPTMPGSVPGGAPDVHDDPDNATGECFPSGWGVLNPVEWVYKPVKCALTWAFKPETSLATRISRMASAVEGRAPFSWFARLSALPTSMGSSCPASWTWTQGGQSNPIICGTAMGDAVRGVRSVLSVLLMGAAVYPFIRSLVYAGTPVIKPTPSS